MPRQRSLRIPSPRNASKNPADGPWCTCSRCGFIWSGARMAFQYDYSGGPIPQNQELLICPRCQDDANPQQGQFPAMGDPQPFRNTHAEPYAVDETDWITTQDEEIISTQDGDLFIEDIPNPDDPA